LLILIIVSENEISEFVLSIPSFLQGIQTLPRDAPVLLRDIPNTLIGNTVSAVTMGLLFLFLPFLLRFLGRQRRLCVREGAEVLKLRREITAETASRAV
jgi:hypothetical protein